MASGRTHAAVPAALVLFLLPISLAAAADALPRLRCCWKNPGARTNNDISFSQNPLVVVLPGDTLTVTTDQAAGDCGVTLLKDGKPYRRDRTLAFTAPTTPGTYYMSFSLSAGGASRDYEMCVFVPYKATGKRAGKGIDVFVDGANVGNYRDVVHSGNAKVKDNPDSYKPPVWWIRITPDNESFEVVPGLPVGNLVAPTEDTGLRHSDLVPVNYAMWTAIETLRSALEAKGIPGSAMKLISVFRTPEYNRMIGSNAFGRHIFGDAFDFYIDLEGDTKASDLNGDGKVDRRDAYRVVAIIENLQAAGKLPMGGVGVYYTIGGDHGLTMHLDTRGHRATWGYLYSAGGKKSEFCWASRCFPDLDRADEAAAAARAAKDGKTYRPPNREPLPAE